MPDFNPYQYQLDELTRKIAESQQLLADSEAAGASGAEMAELARQDIVRLEQDQKSLETASAEFASSGDGSSSDSSGNGQPTFTNCILEVRQGAGGDEAKIWANDLLRMYIRFFDTKKIKFEYIDDLVIKVKGRFEFTGEDDRTDSSLILTVYELLKYESGVHRVQRVPSTEAQGRIHTSTASIAIIPEVQKTAVEVKDSDLQWDFMRAGGAGGQNVNKVNSAVRLTHIPTGIVVSCRQERSQAQNRELALEILRGQLWEIQEEERVKALGNARSAIGRAQRAEKIRTYNYPQNRVTDHRINQSWYNLETMIDGDIEKMLLEVRKGMEALESEMTAVA